MQNDGEDKQQHDDGRDNHGDEDERAMFERTGMFARAVCDMEEDGDSRPIRAERPRKSLQLLAVRCAAGVSKLHERVVRARALEQPHAAAVHQVEGGEARHAEAHG